MADVGRWRTLLAFRIANTNCNFVQPVTSVMATEPLGISQIGLVARSPEGHAAKGMAIKGHEDLWVEIQAHTFRNWVNEHLRSVGAEVRDLAVDFGDGTRLCLLVEQLQKKKLRTNWIRRPMNQHHCLENVTVALTAIGDDGVKLVNIGESNVKRFSFHLYFRYSVTYNC